MSEVPGDGAQHALGCWLAAAGRAQGGAKMPDDAALAARRHDALVAGAQAIGLGVLAAVALVSLLAPTASVGSSTRSKEEDDRLLT